MVTRFCNTIFLAFLKKHKICLANANYCPRDCIYKLDILNVFVHVEIPS